VLSWTRKPLCFLNKHFLNRVLLLYSMSDIILAIDGRHEMAGLFSRNHWRSEDQVLPCRSFVIWGIGIVVFSARFWS
jgi:hypothetical protein